MLKIDSLYTVQECILNRPFQQCICFQVKVGDKECDIMNGFYLYITTKLANPAYTPEVILIILSEFPA